MVKIWLRLFKHSLSMKTLRNLVFLATFRRVLKNISYISQTKPFRVAPSSTCFQASTKDLFVHHFVTWLATK